ncbi:MAG: DUF3179 domain-containing protein [Candidatus Niyogibacteria bacterium]|nr:DUF3179 domain-containing protein [Candidatus Niyogibacteria bacterium]
MGNQVIYFFLFVIIAGVVFFYFSNRNAAPIEVAPEVRKQLKESAPLISQDRDVYFSLLEKSAISGGPPKDGIPSIDEPIYTSAEEADEWLLSQDIVFGIDYKGLTAAYPQRIVVWHEIVNVKIGGEDVSLTYCPLTGTAIGFKGEYASGISSEFGVSGKLINSNLLMYDRKSDSYWPQILGTAITDPAKGIRLEEFPVVWTTWEKWKQAHPDTLILSQDTGFFRNYGENGDPYGSYVRENRGYYSSDRLLFEPIHTDSRLHPKEVVVGIRDAEGRTLAILKNKLRTEKIIEASLGDSTVVVTYDQELDFYKARIKETDTWINAFDAMWFSWAAFYPNTELVQ